MTIDHAPALPDTLTSPLVGRLTSLVAAAPNAARTTTNAPYTGAALADLPVSTPADVEDASTGGRSLIDRLPTSAEAT